MSSPLINPTLVAAATPQNAAGAQAARKANAQAYAAAMREAGIAETPKQQAKAAAPAPAEPGFTREAPFGAERPRLQRPGTLLNIVV